MRKSSVERKVKKDLKKGEKQTGMDDSQAQSRRSRDHGPEFEGIHPPNRQSVFEKRPDLSKSSFFGFDLNTTTNDTKRLFFNLFLKSFFFTGLITQ